MTTLAKTLREDLALNPHGDDEGHLRCTCDECISAITKDSHVRVVDPERIRAAFKELDEASYNLPIRRDRLHGEAVKRFNLAKHHVHVLLHETANG